MFRVIQDTASRGRIESQAHLVWEGSLGLDLDAIGGGDKPRPEGTGWSDLSSLRGRASEMWPEVEAAPSLWERVIDEGGESDVWAGETPERWSPLGRADYASFGGLRSNSGLAAGVSKGRGESPFAVDFRDDQGVAQMRLTERGAAIGAMTLTPFAFVVPVIDGATDIRLSLIDDPIVKADLQARAVALEGSFENAPAHTFALLWRLYRGGNSSVVDGVASSPDHHFRIVPDIIEGAAYLVGRLAVLVNRRMRRNDRDPFFRERIAHAEMGDRRAGRNTAEECPDIAGLTSGVRRRAIIAVHGTMGCAVPLARTITEVMSGRGPILRFEHDTWNPIQANARDVVRHIRDAGLTEVLFVAHSRGGLVARQAMAFLRDEAPAVTARLIAVGTPFAGTPIIGAAESGLLGVRATLGALRTLTGPVLDGVSRLAGLLITGRLPLGIAQMHPDDGYFAGFAGSAPYAITGIAGFVDPNGPLDSYGIGVAARRGATDAIFRDEVTAEPVQHDYVVATASASARVDPSSIITVECDHFSYFSHPDVRRALESDPWRAATPDEERHVW